MMRHISRDFLASLADAPRTYRCPHPTSPTSRAAFRRQMDELLAYEGAGLITLHPLPDADDRALAEQTITATLTAGGRAFLATDL